MSSLSPNKKTILIERILGIDRPKRGGTPTPVLAAEELAYRCRKTPPLGMVIHLVPPLAVRPILVRCPRGLFVVHERGHVLRAADGVPEVLRVEIIWERHGRFASLAILELFHASSQPCQP